jgi:hypothetical protein
MRPLLFEFIVSAVATGETGQFHVIGRCGDFPIQVGTDFDVVYKNKPYKIPEEAGRPPVRDQEKPVSLRVVCAHAYQRSLPELGEGMTGSLTIEGDGLDLVAPGWILGRKDEQPAPAPVLQGSAVPTIAD